MSLNWGKKVAPICWVIPPASPSWTFVFLILSSKVVLPVSTWPKIQHTGLLYLVSKCLKSSLSSLRSFSSFFLCFYFFYSYLYFFYSSFFIYWVVFSSSSIAPDLICSFFYFILFASSSCSLIFWYFSFCFLLMKSPAFF